MGNSSPFALCRVISVTASAGKAKRSRALIAKELGSIVYHVLTRQEALNGRFRGLKLTRTKHRRWPRLVRLSA